MTPTFRALLPIVAIGLLATGGCAVGEQAPGPDTGAVETGPFAGQRLTIALPPGRIADFERVIGPEFIRTSGATLELVGLRSADQVARARIERDRASFDVLWIDLSDALVLAGEGLLASVDERSVPNVARMRPEARGTTGIAPVTFASAIGFLYNTERLPEPPHSWSDLWDPRLRGELAWFDFGSNLGPLSLVMAARLAGGDEANVDAGLQKLAELLPNILHFGTSGPANNMLVAQGEAGLTLGLAHQARDLRAGGAPVAWHVPEEGALALPQGFQILAATPRLELALAFLDYTLSTEAQTRFARELYLVASNREVRIDPELASEIPQDRTLYFDFETIGARRGEWTNRFNREILSR